MPSLQQLRQRQLERRRERETDAPTSAPTSAPASAPFLQFGERGPESFSPEVREVVWRHRSMRPPSPQEVIQRAMLAGQHRVCALAVYNGVRRVLEPISWGRRGQRDADDPSLPLMFAWCHKDTACEAFKVSRFQAFGLMFRSYSMPWPKGPGWEIVIQEGPFGPSWKQRPQTAAAANNPVTRARRPRGGAPGRDPWGQVII